MTSAKKKPPPPKPSQGKSQRTSQGKGQVRSAARKPAQASSAPKRNFPTTAVVFVAIAALLVVAIVMTGGEDSNPNAPEFGQPQLVGESLPFFNNPANDQARGQVAPEVIGTDFADTPVEIRHDGTPKAVVFLAHWCPHCQAEVPRVTDWLAETGGVPGVEIVSVATAMDSTRANFPASAWLADERWPASVIRDDDANSVLANYGNGGFPYWVFLNGDGTVFARSAGELEITALEGVLTQLVANA